MADHPMVITDKSTMRAWSRTHRASDRTIALVPTMGFLHQGHLSLVHEAKRHADAVVVSIYVNPGQFSPAEDFSTYPRDLDGDLKKLAEVGGVGPVFCPASLYQSGDGGRGRVRGDEEGVAAVSCVEKDREEHQTWVRVERLEKGLCGERRPVFFRGVATVVAKLFNIVEPDVAVFGKKDYQQWRVIRQMVHDLDFAVNVIGSEIVREADGLAMSSRNVHLSLEEHEKALSIHRSLLAAKSAYKSGNHSSKELINTVFNHIVEAGGRVEYVKIVDQENLETVEETVRKHSVICVAAWFGMVRLIDNMEISA